MEQNAICGLVGRNFVMLAADKSFFMPRYVLVNDNINKLGDVADNLIVVSIGSTYKANQLRDHLVTEHNLHRFRTNISLSTSAIANSTANYVRDHRGWSGVKNISTLIAGYDELDGPSLFRVDAYGSCERMHSTATYGIPGRLGTAVLDDGWYPGITQDKAYRLIKKAVEQIQLRTAANLPRFAVAVVDRGGRRDLPQFTAERYVLEKHGVVKPIV